MDTTLFHLMNGTHSPALDEVMLVATALGRTGFVWLAVATIAAVFPARRMAAWRLVLALACTSLVVDSAMKPLVARQRPYEAREDVRLIDQRPVNSSFPSGHAAAAASGALAAGRLLPEARAVWWVLAGVIAVSRVYVGAHWPSDVVAGFAIGLAVGWFVLGGARGPRGPSLSSAA